MNANINGYDFIHCDIITKAGGVGIYIKQTLLFKQKSDISIKSNFVENKWIEVKVTTGPTVVGVIYQHPTTLVMIMNALPQIYVIFLLNYVLITLLFMLSVTITLT